ncbi:MAG: D-tyrosyl-tRNA(Tyr) deacylase [Desulfovibrionales bacterium]|nr:D-tyrosyl-tRNA(Tyr) deacylase [Desulfovibrionales bacterium]
MRAVVQRVRRASVAVDGKVVGGVDAGSLVLIGFGGSDSPEMVGGSVWRKFIQKLLGLRIFPDEGGPINASLAEHGGGILVVSQFTLYADVRKGRRPSFSDAAKPHAAQVLYAAFVTDLRRQWPHVAEGVFGADMDLSLVNWGPVTIWLDSDEL